VRVLLGLTLADCVVGSALAPLEIESILATGPVLAALGVYLVILAARSGCTRTALLGMCHIAITVGTFLLINLAGWGPDPARLPVSMIAVIYTVATVPLFWRAFREHPKGPDNSRCQQCGYLLYGLIEPRCPECGTPFDPMAVPAMPASR
jgi:hypothetical protein